MGRNREIDHSLKSWLDNVIIPALVRQYAATSTLDRLRLSVDNGENAAVITSADDAEVDS
jgi:hypothetical protein